MDEMDMIFLFQQYFDETDLSWLEGIDKRVREEEKKKKEEGEQNDN